MPRRSRSLPAFFLLLLIALTACRAAEKKQVEPNLKETLTSVRGAIAKFHAEKKRYPYALEELAPNYLQRVPLDPIANAPLVTVTEEPVVAANDFDGKSAGPAPRPVVIDVRSSAPGVDSKGVRYSDY